MSDEQKHPGGAPSKLTRETKNKILAALQLSATYELACKYAGISYPTFRNWMKRGEAQADQEAGDEYLDFYREVTNSEGISAILCLQKIEKAAEEGSWQAAAWKLERRYPQQYGKTVQELQGKDGAPIEYANLTPDERDSRIAEILEAARARRANEAGSSGGEEPQALDTASGSTIPGVSHPS